MHRSVDHARRFVTAVGGYERAVLEDGSSIELNTNSEARVSFTDTVRRVELVKGEATFRVAPEPHRPFVVAAGDTEIRAVGTVFNVQCRRDGVEILIVEGHVAVASTVSPLQALKPDTTPDPVLRAGQVARAEQARLEVRVAAHGEVERHLAWQHGMLSFDAQTLADAVAELPLPLTAPPPLAVFAPVLLVGVLGGAFGVFLTDDVLV